MTHRLHLLLMTVGAITLLFSCKDPAYDLKDIDTTIKIGGDSLALPIGSTDTLRLNQFLNLDQNDFLSLLADGSYGIRMNDSIDVDVPVLDASELRIEDISVREESSFPLSEINLDDLIVPEIAVTERVGIPLPNIDVSGFILPPFTSNTLSRVGLFEIYTQVTDAAGGLPIPPSQAVTIPTIENRSQFEETFSFSNNQIDTKIKSIQSVFLSNASAVTLTINKSNFDNLAGVDITIDSIWVEFPSVCKLANGSSEYLETNKAFTGSSMTVTIPVKSLDLSALSITNQSISFSDQISVKIRYRCEGTLTYGQLPSTEELDAKISITSASNFEVDYVAVETNTMAEDLPRATIPINISNDFDPMITHIGRITVTNSRLAIEIVMPTLPLSVQTSSTGINIKFPQWIDFQSNPNLNAQNVYSIKGAIPRLIELPIEALDMNMDLVDGNFNITDSIVMWGQLEFPSQEINSNSLDGTTRQLTLNANMPTIQITEITLGSLRADIEDLVEFSLSQTDFPQEIHSLDSLFFSGGNIGFAIELKELPDLGTHPYADLTLDFPDELIFAPGQVEAGNLLKIQKSLLNNKLDVALNVRGIVFDGQPLNGTLNKDFKISMTGSFSVENPTLNVEDIRGKTAKVITIGSIKDLSLARVYGRINPIIAPQAISVAFEGLPEMLKGDSVVLDFDNPYLALEAVSNLGIPIKAKAIINPYRNGQILSEGTQNVDFSIPRSPNALTNAVAKYWIAKNSQGMPSDYTLKVSPLSNLIQRIPDSIQFMVDVKSDLTQQHEYDIAAAYKAKLRYDLVVPLAFGPNLKIVLQDTIADLPSIVGQLLSGNCVEINGEVANTLPLDLELLLLPIDKEFHVIPIEPARQTIKAGTRNGTETRTKLSLTIADPQKMVGDLHGFILVFTATTGEDSDGTPITEQSYVKAKLGVKIPGGFTLKP